MLVAQSVNRPGLIQCSVLSMMMCPRVSGSRMVSDEYEVVWTPSFTDDAYLVVNSHD